MKVQTRTTLEQKMLPLKMNNSVQSKKNITFTAFQKMNSFTYIFKTFCRHFELSCHFLKNQNWPLPRSITVLSDCWLKIWRGKHVNSYQRESFEKKLDFLHNFIYFFRNRVGDGDCFQNIYFAEHLLVWWLRFKISVLKYVAKFTAKHLYYSLFLINLSA